jgi:tRNA(fMet)-specific endonuclease VapC
LTYLLDTNACIALINGRPQSVRERFALAAAAGERMATSSVVSFELWYGVAKSAQRESNEIRLSSFLAGPLELVEFDEEDAHIAGVVRAHLEAVGTAIGAYDLLIAAQGVRRGATVITANGSEFGRVPDLLWEDWAAAG